MAEKASEECQIKVCCKAQDMQLRHGRSNYSKEEKCDEQASPAGVTLKVSRSIGSRSRPHEFIANRWNQPEAWKPKTLKKTEKQ